MAPNENDERLVCDECGATFDDTDAGGDALFSHCCVTEWKDETGLGLDFDGATGKVS